MLKKVQNILNDAIKYLDKYNYLIEGKMQIFFFFFFVFSIFFSSFKYTI